MNQIEVFQVLGIEPTKDERVIKNAYREKLGVTNPEDNPEGFKRLRVAFEEACRLAKQSEETESAEEERDTSPSGLWMEKAVGIYNNIISRQQTEQWRELFADDIFLSLEEEENCRFKFLGFLMSHYKLPTEVWKLLDEKLNIVKDRAQLREHFPADFVSFIASKCERGEDVVFEQFEGEPNAPYDLFLQYYEQCYRALDEGQLEQAASLVANADGLHIYHPVMEVCRAELYEKQGKVQEALDLLTELRSRFPKDPMVCYNCGEMMWRNGQREEAASVYEALKEENDSHYMSNVRLTEWYYEQKRYKDAKQCAEKVLSAGGDDDFMELLKKINCEIERELEDHYRKEKDWESGLELGWCYLQDGKIDCGIRLVKGLESVVPEDRYSELRGLMTKLLVEETNYEEAEEWAAKWERALQARLESDEPEEEKEKDRDRVRQYHMIMMHCLRARGDMQNEHEGNRKARISRYEQALEQAAMLKTGTSKDIGLLLEEAQIYLEMEEYEKCLEITQKLITDYQVYAAYATEAEAYRRQWNASGVVQAARQCINYFPNYIRAYEHIAKVFLDLERKEDLSGILQEAEQNGIKSVILDAYRYQMDHEVPSTEVLDEKLAEFRRKYRAAVEKGDRKAYEEGLPILTEYLYWYPGTYMLVERGIFHRVAHQYQEAIDDFEKALAENPRNQYALYGLSFVYRYMGEFEKALIYIKRAIRYREDDNYGIFADLANIYSLLGNYGEALNAYNKFALQDGYKNVYHMNRRAVCMARCGQVDQAIQTLKEANKDCKFDYYDKATDIYQMTGRGVEAEKLIEEWHNAMLKVKKTLSNENYRQYYCKVYWQELLYGEREKVLSVLEKQIKYEEASGFSTGDLCDAVFCAILCGDDRKGRIYAAQLRRNLEKEKTEQWYKQSKGELQSDVLAQYYTLTAEELQALLNKESECEICQYCSYCICKELEGVRVLLLLRMGRTEEAMERIEKNLEKQPLDEYMLAIRHMCETGIRVTQEADIVCADDVDIQAEQGNDAGEKKNGLLARLGRILAREKN